MADGTETVRTTSETEVAGSGMGDDGCVTAEGCDSEGKGDRK